MSDPTPAAGQPIPWLLGRIHRATITRFRLGLVRRLVIDPEILLRAGLAHLATVQVTGMDRSATCMMRLLAGRPGSREVSMCDRVPGRFRVGDRLVVCGYAPQSEAPPVRPRLVVLGPHNIVVSASA